MVYESLSEIFKICHLQSALIFSILNHSCTLMGYYYLFAFFFYLGQLLFSVFLNLKII